MRQNSSSYLSSPYGSNRPQKTTRNLSNSELQDIAEAMQKTDNPDLQSVSDVESFLDWYRNIFGQIALEILIADCKDAVKKKEYKKLLEIINGTQRFPKSYSIDQAEMLIDEYEKEFENLNKDAVQTQEDLPYEVEAIAFGEIVNFVDSLEDRLAQLVVNGDISAEEARVAIDELRDIDASKFATLFAEDIEHMGKQVQNFALSDFENLSHSINSLEVPERVSSLVDLADNEIVTFGQVQTMFKDVELSIDKMVEKGEITVGQAVDLVSKFEDTPVSNVGELTQAGQAVLAAIEGRQVVQSPVENVVETNGVGSRFGEDGFIAPGEFRSEDQPGVVSQNVDGTLVDVPVLSDPAMTNDSVVADSVASQAPVQQAPVQTPAPARAQAETTVQLGMKSPTQTQQAPPQRDTTQDVPVSLSKGPSANNDVVDSRAGTPAGPQNQPQQSNDRGTQPAPQNKTQEPAQNRTETENPVGINRASSRGQQEKPTEPGANLAKDESSPVKNIVDEKADFTKPLSCCANPGAACAACPMGQNIPMETGVSLQGLGTRSLDPISQVPVAGSF